MIDTMILPKSKYQVIAKKIDIDNNMNGKPTYPELIRFFLRDAKDFNKSKFATITLEEEIGRLFSLNPSDLLKKSRKVNIINARRTYFYVLNIVLHNGPTIVSEMTGYDHATVCYHSKNIKKYIDTEKDYRYKVESLIRKINNEQIKL
jgi:chromosomal replication initiation ATPase DnaA